VQTEVFDRVALVDSIPQGEAASLSTQPGYLSVDAALCVCSLQTEVYELRQSIQILKEKQRCAELALCRLQKTRSRLECEINGKASTIHIDSNFCLKLRDSQMLDARSGTSVVVVVVPLGLKFKKKPVLPVVVRP